MTTAAVAVDELRDALTALAGALAGRDIDGMLQAEPRIAAALDGTLRLGPVCPDERAAVLTATRAARSALARCERLGLALSALTSDLLAVSGESAYSRTGAGASPSPGPRLQATL